MVSIGEVIIAIGKSILSLRDYIESINLYRKVFMNYQEVLKSIITRRFPLYGVLRTGKKVLLTSPYIAHVYLDLYKWMQTGKIINISEECIEFEYYKKYLKIHGYQYGDIFATFMRGEYDTLNVKDKTVVDIGASIGETAIFFALKGAKKVIALEPYPRIYEIAVKNVNDNNLSDIIRLVNAGGGCRGEKIVDPELKTDAATPLVDSKDGIKIPIYSLDTIVEKFNVDYDSVLKIDCEGCEYDLLFCSSPDYLNKFEQIFIEYHYGYRDLTNYLKKNGYKVKHSYPVYIISKKYLVGYINALKNK